MKYYIMINFVFLFGVINSVMAQVEKIEFKFDAQKVKDIELNSTQGDITIKKLDNNKKEGLVVMNKTKFGNHCQLDYKTEGSLLKLSLKKIQKKIKGNCQVDFTISLQETEEIELKIGQGNVGIQKLKGDKIEIDLGQGDIAVEQSQYENMESKQGQGKLSYKGQLEKADINSGQGEINVTLTSLPKKDKGSLKISTGQGNAHISLPEGKKVNARLESGMGKIIDNKQRLDLQSHFKVKMETGMGNLYLD